MKKYIITIVPLCCLGLSSCDDSDLGTDPAPSARGSLNSRQKAMMMKRFDADEDGTLNDEERAAIRKVMRERRTAQSD